MISAGSGMDITSIILILTDGGISDQTYAQQQVYIIITIRNLLLY